MAKKRFISFLCVLVLVISLSSTFAYAEGSTASPRLAGTDYIAIYNLKIRDAQSTAGNVVANASKLDLLGSSDSSGWGHGLAWSSVTYNNKFGYARNDLICPEQGCYKVNTSAGLNVRETASTAGVRICTIPYGTYVCVNYYQGTWAYITIFSSDDLDGEEGYVSSTYLTKVYSN